MNNNIEKYEIFVDARSKLNYYKGEILPFIHFCCRKNMTSGDIDGVLFDYQKKIFYIIEQKRPGEKIKESQTLLLQFQYSILIIAKESERYKDWKFGVYRITGNPPFESCKIESINQKATFEHKEINREKLIAFLNLDIAFENIIF